MAEWITRFEVPDVIGLADYVFAAQEVARELSGNVRDREPHPLVLFPYPNGPDKLRWFALVHPEDAVVLRAAAGRVAATTDPLLSSRACAYRLRTRPPAWRFRSHKKAHERYRRMAVRLLREGQASAMCSTDVRRYYPSIDLGLLASSLAGCGCDPLAVSLLQRLLDRWQDRDGLPGLPVGPEASAVLGNVFLKPVDDCLEALGVEHLRWMDDMLLLAGSPKLCRAAVGRLDHELTALQLLRSTAKTEFFDTPQEAIDHVEDRLLVSLGIAAKYEPEISQELVHLAFEEEILDTPSPHPRRYRWILRQLTNRRDPFGVRALTGDVERMNVDPRDAAEYVRVAGLDLSEVVDEIMGVLGNPPSDRRDGLDLHLLRAMSSKEWGSAEGNAFLRVADDGRRRGSVRCWAYRAAARTPAWKRGEMVDRLHTEADASVRRAIVASFSERQRDRHRAVALRHVRRRFPEHRHTADWVEAA